MTMPSIPTLILLGPQDGAAAAIGARLIERGTFAPSVGDGACTAVLVDAVDDADEKPFLELTDADFDRLAVAPTVTRAQLLQTALRRAAEDAAIVVVISDAYLGRWHGAARSAASAAMVGAVRCVAMDPMHRGLRTNAIALPVGRCADEAVLDAAALHAGALLLGGEMNGGVVLIDRGENLRLRQARRR